MNNATKVNKIKCSKECCNGAKIMHNKCAGVL